MTFNKPLRKNVDICLLEFSWLTQLSSHIYFTLFCSCGIFAIVSNSVLLFVLQHLRRRTKSHKIVTSLVFSDALAGYFVYPLTAWLVLNSKIVDKEKGCTLKHIWMICFPIVFYPSAMTVALIAYDRYIMLTKFCKYHSYVTNTKINIYLVIVWLFSAVVGCLWIIHRLTYTILVFPAALIPLLILCICYVYIARTVQRTEKEIMNHKHQKRKSFDDRKENTRKNSALKSSQERRRIKLAQKVSILIGCYICCTFPACFHSFVVVIYFIFIKSTIDYKYYSHYYTVSILTLLLNSCLNPILYVSKDPEFRRTLKRLLSSAKQKCLSSFVSKNTETAFNQEQRFYSMKNTCSTIIDKEF